MSAFDTEGFTAWAAEQRAEQARLEREAKQAHERGFHQGMADAFNLVIRKIDED